MATNKVVLVEHRFHLLVPTGWTIEDINRYTAEHFTAVQRIVKDLGCEVVADISGSYPPQQKERKPT